MSEFRKMLSKVMEHPRLSLGIATAAVASLFPAVAEAKNSQEPIANDPDRPICTIYNAKERWGDCTNGRTGGQWFELPNGCVALFDESYRGVSLVVACPEPQPALTRQL